MNLTNMQPRNFEICARAFIQIDGKILLCQAKGKGHFFLPGGHVEFGETALEALTRELDEELGVSINNADFMGTVENIYREGENYHHEINLVFRVELETQNHTSKEDQISFTLFTREEFKKIAVLPLALKENIIQWFDDGKMFFAAQKDSPID